MEKRLKRLGYAILLLTIFQFGFTKYSHDKEIILKNRSLISQIHNYALYLKRVSNTYKIKEYAIVINYTKEQTFDKYVIFTIFFSNEIKKSNPSFVLNLNGQMVIFHDDTEPYHINNKLINYIKNTSFPNEQDPWDTAHTWVNSVTLPGQSHKTPMEVTNFDSKKIQDVPISPKSLFLTYRNVHLINMKESQEWLTQ